MIHLLSKRENYRTTSQCAQSFEDGKWPDGDGCTVDRRQVDCPQCLALAGLASKKFLVFTGPVLEFESVEDAERHIEGVIREDGADVPDYTSILMVSPDWLNNCIVYENRGIVVTIPTEAGNYLGGS